MGDTIGMSCFGCPVSIAAASLHECSKTLLRFQAPFDASSASSRDGVVFGACRVGLKERWPTGLRCRSRSTFGCRRSSHPPVPVLSPPTHRSTQRPCPTQGENPAHLHDHGILEEVLTHGFVGHYEVTGGSLSTTRSATASSSRLPSSARADCSPGGPIGRPASSASIAQDLGPDACCGWKSRRRWC